MQIPKKYFKTYLHLPSITVTLCTYFFDTLNTN